MLWRNICCDKTFRHYGMISTNPYRFEELPNIPDVETLLASIDFSLYLIPDFPIWGAERSDASVAKRKTSS